MRISRCVPVNTWCFKVRNAIMEMIFIYQFLKIWFSVSLEVYNPKMRFRPIIRPDIRYIYRRILWMFSIMLYITCRHWEMVLHGINKIIGWII